MGTNKKLQTLNNLKRGLKLGPKFKGLNDRQRAFVMQYTTHWDATKACRDVGYKSQSYATKLLDGKSFPLVAAAVAEIQMRNEEKSLITAEEIQKELTAILRSDITDLYEKGWFVVDDPKQLSPTLRKCIKKVTVDTSYNEEGGEVRKVVCELYDKLRSADMLAKFLGMYSAQEINVNHGINWDGLYEAKSAEEEDDIIEGAIARAKEK